MSNTVVVDTSIVIKWVINETERLDQVSEDAPVEEHNLEKKTSL